MNFEFFKVYRLITSSSWSHCYRTFRISSHFSLHISVVPGKNYLPHQSYKDNCQIKFAGSIHTYITKNLGTCTHTHIHTLVQRNTHTWTDNVKQRKQFRSNLHIHVHLHTTLSRISWISISKCERERYICVQWLSQVRN